MYSYLRKIRNNLKLELLTCALFWSLLTWLLIATGTGPTRWGLGVCYSHLRHRCALHWPLQWPLCLFIMAVGTPGTTHSSQLTPLQQLVWTWWFYVLCERKQQSFYFNKKERKASCFCKHSVQAAKYTHNNASIIPSLNSHIALMLWQCSRKICFWQE